jgi:lipopolysaccharide export system permease protein
MKSKSLETDLIFNLSMDQRIEDLKRRIEMYKLHGVDTAALETNLQFKLAIPFSCIVCILLTTPLSIGGARARAGIMKSIVLVLVFMTLYYISMIVAVALGHSGTLEPVVAAWAQNGAFAAIGLLLAVFYMRK